MSDAMMSSDLRRRILTPLQIAAANDEQPADGHFEGDFGPLRRDGSGAHVQIPTYTEPSSHAQPKTL